MATRYRVLIYCDGCGTDPFDWMDEDNVQTVLDNSGWYSEDWQDLDLCPSCQDVAGVNQ